MEIVTVHLKDVSPEIHEALERVRAFAYADKLFFSRHKLLVALAIAAAVKCEPCVRMYAEKAVHAGATRAEAVEILNVVMAMGGCVGEAWVQKALVAFENFARRQPVRAGAGEQGCCPA